MGKVNGQFTNINTPDQFVKNEKKSKQQRWTQAFEGENFYFDDTRLRIPSGRQNILSLFQMEDGEIWSLWSEETAYYKFPSKRQTMIKPNKVIRRITLN